jgi:hypothetical protein
MAPAFRRNSSPASWHHSARSPAPAAISSRKGWGWGLGLSIAAALVEIHGGKLTVASVEGEGTEVNIRFPASRTRNRAPVDAMRGQEANIA